MTDYCVHCMENGIYMRARVYIPEYGSLCLDHGYMKEEE